MENSNFSFLFGHMEALHTYCLVAYVLRLVRNRAASGKHKLKCWIKILQRLPIFRMSWMKTSSTNPFFCTKMRAVGISSIELDLQFMLSSNFCNACAFVQKRQSLSAGAGPENSERLLGMHTDYNSSKKCCISWCFPMSIFLLVYVNLLVP